MGTRRSRVTALLVLACLALPGFGQAPPDSGEDPARGTEPAWGLPDETLESLAASAERYREFALRFTAVETVRNAVYDGEGQANQETTRRYSFLLERAPDGQTFREYRERMRDDGTARKGAVDDEEPFPPAYAWIFLFSEFHQPFFAYRDLGTRFEGFDWVREIEFRGSLPFTDGKDIRQWHGTILVDATSYTPLEIHAKPSAQDERIRAMFDRWVRAFNLIGVRLAPRPFGYECRVEFHMRRSGLTFPTRLRYDKFRAVSSKRTVPVHASTRYYEDYRFFRTGTTETPGDVRP